MTTVDTIDMQVGQQCITDLEVRKKVKSFILEPMRYAAILRFRQRLPVTVRYDLTAFHTTRGKIQQQLKEAVHETL